MQVRRRLPAAVVGLALFTALGALGEDQFWRATWFYIGVGMVLSATFVEPFFSRPQDAIVNAVAGISLFVAADKQPVLGLWIAYLGCLILVLAAGMFSSIATESNGSAKWVSFRIASRLGRASVVGTTGLLLTVITQAASHQDGFQYLAGATAVLVAATSVDWPGVFSRVRRRQEVATTVAVIGPRMLLTAVADATTFAEGNTVEIEAGKGIVHGGVVARLPHQQGVRYQIALAEDWTAIADRFPEDVVIRLMAEDGDVIGAVDEGTTDRRLEFQPFTTARVGTPVCLRVENKVLLYQIAQVSLVKASWAGANAVVPRAVANVIGWPEDDGFIRSASHLPEAHEPITRVGSLEASLPPDFFEVGKIKGTNVPVGFSLSESHQGHLAVLGMSGMGKTTAAQRICKMLGETSMVVALDITGEYATRLGFQRFDDDLDTNGYSVYEPAGDPPRQASDFVKKCMEAGHAEYRQGDGSVRSRVLLLEEAHSFVPEWNFAQRNQQDNVSYTTRMIMQSRKFGITFVIVSQRTAVVSKSALSQCENYIVLKTIDQTSLDYLESVVGKEMRAAITSLQRYEAICVGPAFNAQEPVIVTLTPP